MEKSLKAHIENALGIRISKIRSLSGGDISKAFLLETETDRFFCKVNHNKDAYTMFLAEKQGLEAISRTKTMATPTVLGCEAFEKGGYLVLEYIAPKRPSDNDMALLGHQLAALHENSDSKTFGWVADNFIGSLAQRNTRHADWTAFYIRERLAPQLQLALAAGKLFPDEIPSEARLEKACGELFPDTEPCLLHGDLWSGNYLIAQDGTPYLIDPATYFGHHEVDIAMTRLFGGFDAAFYTAYREHFPKIEGEKERTEIYQLYYVLVHLNLFGSSYKASVTAIMNTYFQ